MGTEENEWLETKLKEMERLCRIIKKKQSTKFKS